MFKKKTHTKKKIIGFQSLPRGVLMYCCGWWFPCVQQYQTEVEKSHCVTQISPLCPLHSAARLKSRHLSTPAANTTTSPPRAVRGWGEKRPALSCKHTQITCTVHYYCTGHLFKCFAYTVKSIKSKYW